MMPKTGWGYKGSKRKEFQGVLQESVAWRERTLSCNNETIATDKLLPYLPFGTQWSNALRAMSKLEPTKNRQIKARIYKDFESLRAYQVNNLKNLRTQELEKGIENV